MTAVAPHAMASREQAIAGVERQLALVVQRARARWRHLALAVHPELQPIGYRILVTLVDGGPASAVRLGEELATDKSTLSRQISHLEKLGLVRRRPDPADHRVRLLEVPDQTAARLAEVRQTSLSDLRSELRRWELTDVEALAGLLARLTSVGSEGSAAIRPTADGG